MRYKIKKFSNKTQKKTELNLFFRIFIIFVALIIPVSQSFATIDDNTLRFYSKNNILYYDPTGRGQNSNCYGSSYDGEELNLIGSTMSASEQKQALIKTYAPLAIALQREYGIPWELPFIIMGQESNYGTEKTSGGVANNVSKKGYYNYMGLTYNNSKWDVGEPYVSSTGRKWEQYPTISNMLISFTVDFLRNGVYDESIKLLISDPEKAIWGILQDYAPPIENNTEQYVKNVINEINEGLGDSYPSSAELFASEKIQPGGNWPINGSIRNEVWAKYGSAGLPSSSSSPTSNTQNYYIIGDSTTDSSISELENIFKPNVNSLEFNITHQSSFYDSGSLKSLPDLTDKIVIYSIGTDISSADTINKEDLDNIISAIKEKNAKAIIVVKPYNNNSSIQIVLDALFTARSDISVINWSDLANSHPEYYSGSNITNTGKEAYANLINNFILKNQQSVLENPCFPSGLTSGGLSLSQAASFMTAYSQEASRHKKGSYKFQDAYVYDAGCDYGTLNNCSAFSEWFVNKYGGYNITVTYSGKTTAKKYIDLYGFEDHGNTPHVYDIFSRQSGGKGHGHTGVVLGINESENKIYIGEADCFKSNSNWPGVHEYNLSDYMTTDYVYAGIPADKLKL